MADACGWGAGHVGFPRRDDGRGNADPIVINGQAYRARDLRSTDRPAFALTEKARSWSRWDASGERHRVTLQEAQTLQTFPAWWQFAGQRTNQFLQVGNAVPPLLAERILRTLTA